MGTAHFFPSFVAIRRVHVSAGTHQGPRWAIATHARTVHTAAPNTEAPNLASNLKRVFMDCDSNASAPRVAGGEGHPSKARAVTDSDQRSSVGLASCSITSLAGQKAPQHSHHASQQQDEPEHRGHIHVRRFHRQRWERRCDRSGKHEDVNCTRTRARAPVAQQLETRCAITALIKLPTDDVRKYLAKHVNTDGDARVNSQVSQAVSEAGALVQAAPTLLLPQCSSPNTNDQPTTTTDVVADDSQDDSQSARKAAPTSHGIEIRPTRAQARRT